SLQRTRTEPARGPKIMLPSADGDSGKSVHDIAVRIIAESDIDEQLRTVDRVGRIPIALRETDVAGARFRKRGRRLVADQVVLGSQHVVLVRGRSDAGWILSQLQSLAWPAPMMPPNSTQVLPSKRANWRSVMAA